MEKVVLNITKKGKIRSLLEVLRSLDYIESIETNNKKRTVKKRKRAFSKSKERDFFKMAGLWKDKKIDLKRIREKAWKKTSN